MFKRKNIEQGNNMKPSTEENKNFQNDKEEEEEEKNGPQPLDEREEENYEFLIPISNDNKLKTFVDRYFLKYFEVYSKEEKLFQYAFVHTNKYVE